LNSVVSVGLAAVSGFVLSSIWYTALTPVEARLLGAAAPERGGRPSSIKVLLELARTLLVGAVVAGVAHASHRHGVGPTVVLGLALWLGFRLVLLTGSVIWEQVPPVKALLHAR